MNESMKFYIDLVYFLKQTLSNAYEVFLFDTLDDACPLVAMSAKNRDNEKCARQFVTSVLKSGRLRAKNMVMNRSVQPDFGKLVRASVIFVRGAENEIVGAMCVLMHCNYYLKMQELLNSLLQFDLTDPEEGGDAPASEVVPAQQVMPQEPSVEMIDQVFANLDMDPTRLTIEEKQELICDLYDMDAFKAKGGVARVAEHLKMSEQSVYRYISKIRRLRG